MATKSIPITNAHAGGIDIGCDEVFVSVDGETVERFKTFTHSYRELITYLQTHAITTVAMEATGVYWVSLYEMLDAARIAVCLVNGAHVKNIQGPKSDVKDCRWLQRLHSYGLLRASFIPPEHIRQLRTYVRLRDDHIRSAAQCVQHMQKALDQMNIKLHRVISDVTGASGMRILEALLAGERSAAVLLSLCERSIRDRKSVEVISSLEGTYRDDQLFALGEAVDCWKFYQEKIRRCDAQIESSLREMTRDLPPPSQPVTKQKKTRRHEPAVQELHTMLVTLTEGKNPAAITGLADHTFMKIVAEVGTDMSAWATAKHFTAWAKLAPLTKQSGKRTTVVHQRQSSRVGQMFRSAAQSLAASTNNALGGFYRRLKARRGPKVAMKAVARKLAVTYYNVMKHGIDYVEIGRERYEQIQEEARRKSLELFAKKLHCRVVPISDTI